MVAFVISMTLLSVPFVCALRLLHIKPIYQDMIMKLIFFIVLVILFLSVSSGFSGLSPHTPAIVSQDGILFLVNIIVDNHSFGLRLK